MEVHIQNKAKELDPYQITNILRSLSHALDGRMWGSDKTFIALEPSVLKNIDKFTDRDISHVIYAYSVRKAGNPEIYKAFDKRIENMCGRLDYPSLHNVIYYLLFRENANKKIWTSIIESVVNNEDWLPIIYYRPFKASILFLQHHFPELDL